MASQQARRENKTDEREIHVEKDKVPKMATHFESLTVKDSGDQPEVVHQVIETTHVATLNSTQGQEQKQKGSTIQSMQKKDGGEYKGPSLEEISKYRGTAQQNSMEAIRAAEELYQNASKSSVGEQQTGETGQITSGEHTKKNLSGATAYKGAQKTSEQKKDYGLIGTAVDAGKKGITYVGKAANVGKNIALETTAKNVGKAAGVLKDVGVVAGYKAAEFAGDTAGMNEGLKDVSGQTNQVVAGVIDTAADMTEKGASYVGETAVAGKDITMETGKTAGQYVSKAAGVLKDIATVAGWKAAELASGVTGNITDVSAQATDVAGGVINTAADVGQKGASYVGDTAVAGRDITMETGRKTAEYAGKAAGVLKDAAVVGGWNTAEFAAGVTENVQNVSSQATDVAGGVIDTAVNVGQKGMSYVGDTAVAGKDITLDTGKKTAEYAGKAAGVVKDAAVVGGWNAAEFASDTGAGVKETLKGVSGQAIDVAGGVIDTTVDVGGKGAGYLGDTAVIGKDITLEMGKKTAEYAGKAAGVLKDVAVVGGWNAAEFAGNTGSGVKETLKGVSGQATDVAGGAIDRAVDVGEKGARYVADTAIAGKDITLETGKTTAGYAGKGVSMVKDAAVVGGWNAAELATNTAVGVKEGIKDVTGQANEVVAGFIDKTAELSEKGARSIGETAVAGKDITFETGKATAGYVGKVAAELASDTAEATATVLAKAGTKVEESAATRNKTQKERESEAKNFVPSKVEGELGGYKIETRTVGDVGSGFKNQGRDANKGSCENCGNQVTDTVTVKRCVKCQGSGTVMEESHLEHQGGGGETQVNERRWFR